LYGWALDRDAMIAKRLADAYYNKYYDKTSTRPTT
jgi:hypothetical protein